MEADLEADFSERFFSGAFFSERGFKQSSSLMSLWLCAPTEYRDPACPTSATRAQDLIEFGNFYMFCAYTVRMGPGYLATNASVVRRVMLSTVACATNTRSNGSL